ncbi:hypothetical protein ACFVH6_06745 [Spirillospora sp. NPDC127200]
MPLTEAAARRPVFEDLLLCDFFAIWTSVVVVVREGGERGPFTVCERW